MSGSASVPEIAAVILAAGESRRMAGINKLLVEVDGTPIVARVIDAVLASRAGPVIVVTGHQGDAVEAVLRDRCISVVRNSDYPEGLGSSLRCGINAVAESADGALICLGDMPWITSRHIDRLIDAFEPDSNHTIYVPVCRGRRGNPVLFGRRHFSEILAIRGDTGARQLIEKYADAVQSVIIEDDAVFRDVDVPADLEPTDGGQ